VLRRERCHFHQGPSGILAVQQSASGVEAPLVAALSAAGLPARAHPDMIGIMWGKLLLNLNNPVNALAGVPLREELANRTYRRVFAACMKEGLRALSVAGIVPRIDQPLRPWLVPTLLGLPNVLFRQVAARMIRIDPQARSSMWEDLERGRTTEVDALNGEIVRLAARAGLPAPVNAAIVALIKEAEGHGSPRLSADALYARVCR
jgi:2-dehydropantoate 2-reductase